jgi:hypothetical protein
VPDVSMRLALGLVVVTTTWAALAAGCVRVRPHERERLAHPAMQAPVWPAVEEGDLHVFTVREGTTGATGAGGAGCGCN